MGKNISGFGRGVEFYAMMKHIFPSSNFLSSSNTVSLNQDFFFVMDIVKKIQYLKTIHKYLTSETQYCKRVLRLRHESIENGYSEV